jgi:predicted transglutaminase-like cysteine proteinase
MKFWSLAILVSTVAYGVIAEGANARSISVRTSPNEVPQMTVYGATEAPIGHVKFCYYPAEDCRAGFDNSAQMLLTTRRWTELQTINREVNREIKPLSDQAQYGMVENWTFPVSGRGDCEDYVVLKRQKLMELGWPSGALLITVVRDEAGEGHAVLTARTHRGDLILDNKHSDILAWSNTPYTYIKRQSASDPRHWDSLVPMHDGPTIAASGTDARK